MAIERITIKDNEKFLRQISTEVDFNSDNIFECIANLKEYCQSNAVYAMSPVQIGIPKRLIYIKNTSSDMNKNIDSSYDEELVYINPKIISVKGKTKFLEGCESCTYIKNNEKMYYVGIVERPYSLEVEYFTTNGEKKRETIEDFKATVFCHEYDHLNGILHMDIAEEIYEMTSKEAKTYREQHPYEILSKEDEFKN